jgi:hypothetical protein
VEPNIRHHTSHQSRCRCWWRTSRPWTASSLDPHGALRWRRLTPFHENQSRARFAAIEERRKERIRSSLLSSRSTAAFFAKKKEENRVRRSGCQTAAAAAGVVVGVAGTTTGLLGVPVVVACHPALRRDSQSPRPPTNDCNNAATAAVSNVGRSPPGSVFSRGHLGFIISVRALLVETTERWRRWRVVGPDALL